MLPPIVKNLLIINGLMFLATVVAENQFHLDITRYLGLHFFTSPYFMPHQLVTHMFMHGNFMHIAIPLVFGSVGTMFGVAPVFFANAGVLTVGGLLSRRARSQSDPRT